MRRCLSCRVCASYCGQCFFFFLQGIAQINLTEAESSGEMQVHWYPVQIFTGSEPQRAKTKNQCEESIPQSSGNVTTVKAVWL